MSSQNSQTAPRAPRISAYSTQPYATSHIGYQPPPLTWYLPYQDPHPRLREVAASQLPPQPHAPPQPLLPRGNHGLMLRLPPPPITLIPPSIVPTTTPALRKSSVTPRGMPKPSHPPGRWSNSKLAYMTYRLSPPPPSTQNTNHNTSLPMPKRPVPSAPHGEEEEKRQPQKMSRTKRM